MSSYCNAIAQNCSYLCCNASGLCPVTSGNCAFYYYSPVILGIGAIIGIVIGGIVFITAVIAFSCWLCRRRRQNLLAGQAGVTVMMQGVPQQQYGSPTYGKAPPGGQNQPV